MTPGAQSVPGFDRFMFKSCRVFFSMCILAEAVWYIATFETRALNFREAGLPTQTIYLVFLVFSYFGLRLLMNSRVEEASLGLIVTYCILNLIVYHPFGEGGNGDYPAHMHSDISLHHILTSTGLIGGLLVMIGVPDMQHRRKIMHGSKSYAVNLGRALVAIEFASQALYFRFYQHKLRTTQISMMGGSPFFHVFCVGSVQLVAAHQCWLGRSGTQRKFGAFALGASTAALTVAQNATLAGPLGLYHMKFDARVHHFITQVGVAVACCMLYATAGVRTYAHQCEASEAETLQGKAKTQ